MNRALPGKFAKKTFYNIFIILHCVYCTATNATKHILTTIIKSVMLGITTTVNHQQTLSYCIPP